MRFSKVVVLCGVLALVLCGLATSAGAADVTGSWKSKMETPRGTFEQTFVFQQDGEKLTGKVVTQRGETEIKDGKVNGDEIEFKVERRGPGGNGGTMVVPYKAKVSGDDLKGTFVGPNGQTRDWTATREKKSNE